MESEDQPQKSLGQHWLNDQLVLGTICELAELNESDTVLEIGPGLGPLTALLLARAGKVVAVELDEKLIDKLGRRFAGAKKLDLVYADIRRFNFGSLPKDYKITANIPYYLSSYLLRLLTETKNQPLQAVLLLQKEVAERLAATPGRLSAIGVIVQAYYSVELGPIVPSEAFTPPPKVDSRIVKLVRRASPLLPAGLESDFIRLVKIGFSQKRKTLANVLSSGLHLSKADAVSLLAKAGVEVNARAQQLNHENWLALTRAVFT